MMYNIKWLSLENVPVILSDKCFNIQNLKSLEFELNLGFGKLNLLPFLLFIWLVCIGIPLLVKK